MLGGAFVLWLQAVLISSLSGRPSIVIDLLGDISFAGFYTLLIVAVETRPHRRSRVQRLEQRLMAPAAGFFVGGWLAFFPLTGIIGLTLLLALTFIAEGVLELVFAFKSRENRGWLWFAFSGAIAIAAGVLIAAGLPSTAVWAIGLLVGINILSSGISFLLLATAAKAE